MKVSTLDDYIYLYRLIGLHTLVFIFVRTLSTTDAFHEKFSSYRDGSSMLLITRNENNNIDFMSVVQEEVNVDKILNKLLDKQCRYSFI